MITVTCKDCNKEFTHAKKESAEWALKVHRARVHTAPDTKEAAKQKAEKKAAKLSRKTALATHTVTLNYCPCCGCSLKMVAAGMAMAQLEQRS